MTTDLPTRLEYSRFWLLGRLLIPKSRRQSACKNRGEHKPELVDLGRSKSCPSCGTW